MKEEDNILRKVGTGNAFKAPEGYFKTLTSEVMSKLPEKENPFFEVNQPTTWQKVKPWVYMAAMFIGAAIIIRVGASQRDSSTTQVAIATETEADTASDQYIHSVVDGSMLDDYSLYVYLTDAELD